MKTDRELLKLAAHAAGIEIVFQTLRDGSGTYRVVNVTGLPDAFNMNAAPSWNPLTDDGDALRLAVKLFIDIQHSKILGIVEVWINGACVAMEEYIEDKESATRRAIVRAAAAIGESL